MRVAATAVFWALFASTAPVGITAKGLRRKLVAQKECTIMAAELLAEPGHTFSEEEGMIIECELAAEDANGYSGIIVPIEASTMQKAELRAMINSGSVSVGVDGLDIIGDEIIEEDPATASGQSTGKKGKKIKISADVDIRAKVHKKATAGAKSAKRQRRLVDTTGTLNMLVVKVTDSAGKVYGDSPIIMSDEVFGTGRGAGTTPDPINLKSGMEECSWGQVTVSPGIGDSNEVAEGVIEVSIPITLEGNSRASIRNAVTTAVQDKLGHQLPGPYDYVLYSLENCYVDCGWAGYAFYNSWISVYQNWYYKSPGVLMHEIGHNFNLAHSGGLDGEEYTDHTCTMGNPNYDDDLFQCFNPAKNFQLNWYDDAELTIDPRVSGFSQILTLVGVDEYPIRGNNPVTVRLETGTGADYFVGFNRASETGPNRYNDEGDNQVTVIQVETGSGISRSQSWLRSRMDAGQSYTIPSYPGCNCAVTIAVNSIDITSAPGTAVVSITRTSSPPTPAPTPLPPCPSGEKRLEVEIQTDNYAGETSWTVTEKCGNNNIVLEGSGYADANTLYSSNACVADVAYDFTINDAWGDGICCSYGEGSYLVTFGDAEVASGGQFGQTETKSFGACQPTPTPPPTTGSTNPPTSPPSNPPTPPPTTANPTNNPTNPPSPAPSNPPTPPPTTANPTPVPSSPPSPAPSNPPTPPPTTANPTSNPTNPPSPAPSNPPTPPPTTANPTPVPSSPPTALPTANSTPPPSPAPTDGNSAQPQLAAFDAEYGVPRCVNAGSECDSLQLLNGRGTMSGGIEVNASNTNKKGATCNDGNSGTYGSDESINKITVSAGDVVNGVPEPSDGFIIEGGRAYVSVDVNCWGTGSSDTADIYLTTDIDSPDWELLDSIGCPGGGAQTIVKAFDVPSGANQSIRVNFRYSGSPSTCSPGSWDDHDDLIFAVKSNPNLTPAPTPAPPTPAPTRDGVNGPQMASYDAELQAPKCSFGSECDSGLTLNSRGSIGGTQEPNQPNTLNSCTDGNNGSYHSDESVDKIVVTGSGDGDMMEGDTVTVSATVWCWGSTGSSDYIDFYYASDANNPNWIELGARQQCPGGGLQTVTRQYTLPEGGLQAVRVNIMYGQATVGAAKCTTGTWDDVDDLVISVKPNPAMAGMAVMKAKHDDVQGPVMLMMKDEEGDKVLQRLHEMNQADSKKKGGKGGEGGKGKGSGGGKKKGKKNEEEISEDRIVESSTGKFVCARSEPRSSSTICEDGSEADDTCSYAGQVCGGSGRKQKFCWYAACDGIESTE